MHFQLLLLIKSLDAFLLPATVLQEAAPSVHFSSSFDIPGTEASATAVEMEWLKHEYRKETQEEMKSERISPQKKKVIKISPLPCTSPYLLRLRERQSCTQQLLHEYCGMQPLGMEECPAPARRAFPQSPAVPRWLQALGSMPLMHRSQQEDVGKRAMEANGKKPCLDK